MKTNQGDSMESELFKQMLKGVTYSWDLDPIDRSWFIWPTGEIIGDISHHLILKNTFKKEWQDMIKRGAEDAEIEHTFEKRLILCLLIFAIYGRRTYLLI